MRGYKSWFYLTKQCLYIYINWCHCDQSVPASDAALLLSVCALLLCGNYIQSG